MSYLPLWSPVVGTVAIGGSRYLSQQYAPLVGELARTIVLSGNRLSVGCCVGADSYAVSGIIKLGEFFDRIDCYTICDENLNGGCSLTAIGTVAYLATKNFDSVIWADNLHLPLRARLAIRTKSVILSARTAIFFFGNAKSVGTFRAAVLAVKNGQSVYALGPAKPPSVGVGAWLPSYVFGYKGYRWCPDALI